MTARSEEQRELFQEFAQEAPVRKEAAPGAQPRRFVFTFSFEGLLLSALGGVLVILVSFSVGVEMGRSYRLKLPLPLDGPSTSAGAVKDKPPLAVQRAQVQTPVASSALTPPSIPMAAAPPKPAAAAPAAGAPAVAAVKSSSFIIQIASYKKPEQAQAENLRLIKSGFPSLVRKSGAYYMVVVGPYPTKMEALQSMSRLRNKYHDALVRKSSVN